MATDLYCGMQESYDGWFIPLYNNPFGSTICPYNKKELSDIAFSSPRFIKDFRKQVEEGKKLWLNDKLSSKDTKEVLLEMSFLLLEDIVSKKQYKNPDSIYNEEFYKVLRTVLDEIDIKPFIKRYEKITGYSFNQFLLKTF